MARKGRLTRERIVEAAISLLDREGEKGFSMRKLAGKLEVDPMALYHHHASRGALIHEVLQAMMADFEMPPPGGDWRADLRALCGGLRRLARRHPGAFRVYEYYDRWLPAEHRVNEAFHATLLSAGFDGQATVRAVRLLLTYTEAFAVDEISGWLDPYDPAERVELIDSLAAGAFPATAGLVEEIAAVDADAEFDFGLDVLIAGLEAQRPR